MNKKLPYANQCVVDLRKKMGLSQSKFSKYYHIPLKTIQGWEQGLRETKSYDVEMMMRILRLECENYKLKQALKEKEMPS